MTEQSLIKLVAFATIIFCLITGNKVLFFLLLLPITFCFVSKYFK